MRWGLALLASSVVLAVLAGPTAVAGAMAKQPPTAGITLNGQRLALADLRGKPVVINVWSSW